MPARVTVTSALVFTRLLLNRLSLLPYQNAQPFPRRGLMGAEPLWPRGPEHTQWPCRQREPRNRDSPDTTHSDHSQLRPA